MQLINLEEQPGSLIRRLQALHSSIFTATLGTELTSPQFALLCVVAQQPGIDQGQALAGAHLDRSTGADIVARLKRRHLLKQSVDPNDSRRRSLALTTAGEKLLAELMPRAPEVGANLMDGLDDAEQEMLMSLMRRILERWERVDSVDVRSVQTDARSSR